jgi:hypothetical protein
MCSLPRLPQASGISRLYNQNGRERSLNLIGDPSHLRYTKAPKFASMDDSGEGVNIGYYYLGVWKER